MNDIGETTAHRDLLASVQELLKAVRLVKHDLAPLTTAVPPGTLGVLTAIAAADGTRVTELAADCSLDASTVSRAVAPLVRAGLVSRGADPGDGRATVLTASAAGRAALDDVMSHYDRRFAGAVAGWTPEELRIFAALLDRFTTALLPTPQPIMEAAR
jgi:DNA-binding MarR family transcriptional regulator